MAGAIELEAARRAVLARVVPLPVEMVELSAALGRRLAEDAVATAPVQGFDNSAMDGYAVRAGDTDGASSSPVGLALVGESRAGHPSERDLGPGEAIAISTGAMLPAGADAVVAVEDAARDGDRILARAQVSPGEYVRRAGEDFAAGATVLKAGAHLGAVELGVLAAIGADPAPCRRRPRVAVITTGDELTPADQPLPPGGIRDANAASVPALARLAGAEVFSVESVPDEEEATAVALEVALGSADAIVVSGGVSVGAHDHVKAALGRLGVEEEFWRVALKPGGPTWFGAHDETLLVFGLPGNPVSAVVTFLLLARPALVALAGGEPDERRTRARLGDDCEAPPGRAHAVRCRLELDERGWVAWPTPHQGSHVLTSLLYADCLALVPAGAAMVAGEIVEIELLDRASIGG
ncbi:MAG TPA: gephyrin-like molybdotransferase Glp [Solirubrobacterales bacterium]|nr:gephyrin-like molybdotransferase Glp [Solirubrobacterales bacterium]